MECSLARLRVAIAREMDGRGTARRHRHRVPLGLLMMHQGWISSSQLRSALEAQRIAGTGRLGQWLVRQKAVTEEMVAKALGLQWSCPVLNLELQSSAIVPTAMPRLFIDAFGVIPLQGSAGKSLFLGFEERLDPVLALALERMSGLPVECGIVRESLFRPAHARVLATLFPSVELVEAASPGAAALAFAKCLESVRCVASRLVRVHECLWMRLWSRTQQGAHGEPTEVRDVVCSIGPIA